MAEKRKYELKKRAEKLDETRRKVVEATVELHRTVGPAATQITEIARRAGVQRVTVYNHFREASLLGPAPRTGVRCNLPDLSLGADPGPAERLRTVERALRWYERPIR